MTGRERSRIVAENLSLQISEVAPQGLGHWDEAWEIVREPSDVFLDALGDFELADTPLTRGKLQAAADELVRAWRHAGEEWIRAGCPGRPDREGEEVPA